MNTLYQVLGLLGAGMILFLLYRTIKGRPELFSKENLNKSFFTMGILAIGLIGFIALLILMLRNS
ncbi:hypothetical protein [Legionella fallonii]|uniref:Uncharacterized protein n=1 Tax=Legionella fallonii LLAP-10 TaxID=1212491 RepID=A0A098GAM0_9GAMM|nr:hypothetical protein [Legionella fallonii]CEG59027.1 conserved protein of unknown function [Legionella fallonii LLAP-10]